MDISPSSATGFENDVGPCGANSQYALAELESRDGTYSPRVDACSQVSYYATGSSPGILDAISLTFDVPDFPGVALNPRVRVYLAVGDYPSAWHNARLYAGAFSTMDEDCDGSCCCGSLFPDTPGWEGWIELPVQGAIAPNSTVEFTLRLWDARVDQVQLHFEPTGSPCPDCGGRPALAIGFENEYLGCGDGPIQQDLTSEVSAQDGAYAPRMDPCVFANYFATGQSPGWVDALALHFDLSSFGGEATIAALQLQLYVQKGSYSELWWHAIKLQPGFMSSDQQDCDYSACWALADEFPGDSAWEGWIEREVPVAWIDGNALDLTARIWNARIDAARLVVDSPTKSSPKSWGALKAMYR